MLLNLKFASDVEANPKALAVRDSPGFDQGLVQSAWLCAGLTSPNMNEYELHIANYIIKLLRIHERRDEDDKEKKLTADQLGAMLLTLVSVLPAWS